MRTKNNSTPVFIWILVWRLAPINGTLAQTAIKQHQQIIQQEQQRQQNLRDRIKQQQQQHNTIDIAPEADAELSLAGTCFDITTIELDGADSLPLKAKQFILAPFLEHCIDLNQINQLLKAVSNWYVDHSYVTSRAYVAAQDLSTGHLVVITAVEGTVESIELDESSSRINRYTALPNITGSILKLRDIEQGLEQINRLQSTQATMELLPGSTPGSSVIALKSQTNKTWLASLSRDNSGQESTGEQMNGLFLGIDALLGLNDYSYLNVQKDTAPSSAGKASESIAWHWDMPVGYWSFGVDVSYFDYLSTVNSAVTSFEISGSSLNQTVFLSRILYRDQDSKLRLRTHLERKKTKNFIEDVLLDSSRILSIGNIGIDYEKYLANQSQLTFALNYYRGLRLFGAPKDEDRLLGSPKAQFNKWQARVHYDAQFKPIIGQIERAVTLKSSVTLQHSDDRLFGSEQISIGSLYTVRGYKGSSISAASGGYWRNSLTMHQNIPWGGKVLQRLRLILALSEIVKHCIAISIMPP